MEGVGVVFAVGHALDGAEALLIDADESAGQTLCGGSEAGEVEPCLLALLIELLAHEGDDLQAQTLCLFALAVMLADQRYQRLCQADEADGEGTVL